MEYMILIKSTTYEELNKFFERYKLPKLIQEKKKKTDNLNNPISTKLKLYVKTFPPKYNRLPRWLHW